MSKLVWLGLGVALGVLGAKFLAKKGMLLRPSMPVPTLQPGIELKDNPMQPPVKLPVADETAPTFEEAQLAQGALNFSDYAYGQKLL